ncbi:PDI-like 1-1 isoform 2 [Hibiscus syriacus]|uniref:protein disulfide-isomerase n=1 Tax=Hibiscus syriacus TaxID=106335 RepID=A0A6A3B0W8_HIBSY|nr:PDI-like 1-1 isoform 2 [Hibiscus syriacus]
MKIATRIRNRIAILYFALRYWGGGFYSPTVVAVDRSEECPLVSHRTPSGDSPFGETVRLGGGEKVSAVKASGSSSGGAGTCGHCKNLAPGYEKAASILSKHDPPITLAKVDAKTKCPASTEIKSAEAASDFIGDKKIVMVGSFQSSLVKSLRTIWLLLRNCVLSSDYKFGHTSDAKYLPEANHHYYAESISFQDFNLQALEKFVEESSIPLVTLFNSDPSNHPFVIKFYNNPHDKVMLFANLSGEYVDSLQSKYREVAEQYKGQGISFLLGILRPVKLLSSQVPLIIILNKDGKKYLKANVEAGHIAPWLKDYKEGKVPPYVKSEPIPVENNEPVKVVVADTLEDMVSNQGEMVCLLLCLMIFFPLFAISVVTHVYYLQTQIVGAESKVLLEFYAPWCGHCQKLAPISDKVAVHYEKDANVLIAKLVSEVASITLVEPERIIKRPYSKRDATANDIEDPNFDVKGYPTIYFRSADGNIAAYEGDRTKEGIIDFIEKNRGKTVHQESVNVTVHQESVKDEP